MRTALLAALAFYLSQSAHAADGAKKTVVPTADAAGFSVGSPDKACRLNVRVLAQADGRAFLTKKTISGTTTAIAQDTFLLHRIRPIFAGAVGNLCEFPLVPEFAGGDATTSSPVIQDALISAKLSPAFTLKTGRFTTPIVLEPGSNRALVESPFVNPLAPNRDLGVEALGALGASVDCRFGIDNAQRNNTAGFVREGDNDKTVAGRCTVSPFKGGFSFVEPARPGPRFQRRPRQRRRGPCAAKSRHPCPASAAHLRYIHGRRPPLAEPQSLLWSRQFRRRLHLGKTDAPPRRGALRRRPHRVACPCRLRVDQRRFHGARRRPARGF